MAFGYLELLLLQRQQAFDDAPLFRIGLACEQIPKMGDIGTCNEPVHDNSILHPSSGRPKAILMHVDAATRAFGRPSVSSGASDFIEKPFEDEVLINAIKRAANRFDTDTEEAHDLAAIRSRLDQLSERERQVLTGVVAGLPNKTIADDLSIGLRTVEVHRADITSKMQASNLPELVRISMALELADKGYPGSRS
ncbi:LuxR C-terminal-related transcriptional regulator [Mesorhizobium sp.]|uniref:LuxR C-terminal-related transcriptional regulator n=2 Tax=Mesorhizobium sp. TaxID=1871066 RepID=UPI0025B98EEB|nr:LuxR C-terminal-related transcriptional regulator [Mesorhizobium sp.]